MNFEAWGIKPIPLVIDSWVTFAAVLVVLIIFIWVVARLVTRMSEDSDPAETDRQMLTAINDLRRKGDLSQEEFRSIKGQLIDRLVEDPKSSVTGSSDKEDHADSTDQSVALSVSTAAESRDTIIDSVTRSDLSSTGESADSDIPSEDNEQDS